MAAVAAVVIAAAVDTLDTVARTSCDFKPGFAIGFVVASFVEASFVLASFSTTAASSISSSSALR